jgi:hypothetical protein
MPLNNANSRQTANKNKIRYGKKSEIIKIRQTKESKKSTIIT